MRSTSACYRLHDDFRARAETFFGVDFSDVTVRIDDQAAQLGAAAFACGSTIHLAPHPTPGTTRLPFPLLDEVLGHELAHVVQQRQGRAAPRRRLHGRDVDDDPALEAEAEELGRRFAALPTLRALPRCTPRLTPGRAPRAAAGHRYPGPPIIQRAVTLAGAMLPGAGALSPRAQHVLAFIDQGAAWLRWAVTSTGTRYDFPDEAELLAGIQSGLHASPLVLIPGLGLQVSPIKLMTLEPRALELLATHEAGNTSSVIDAQVQKLLAEHRLRTAQDLALGTRFLDEVGVAGAPLFQAMDLDERIALYDLVQDSEGETAMQADLQKEAAAFAVAGAVTPLAFIDLYKCYLLLAVKHDAVDTTPARRTELARSAIDTLSPCLYGAMACPQVVGSISPVAVARMIQGWTGSGRPIGFPRLSAGILQIIQYTRFDSQTGDAARDLVQAYLAEAQRFFAAQEPGAPVISQDGASWIYPVVSGTMEAELVVNGQGQLTQRWFRLKPPISQPSQDPASPPAAANTPAVTHSPAPAGMEQNTKEGES